MIFRDYYKILGLDTNKVSIDEIKIAFREQAKKYHPDVNMQNKKAEERFKDINEAYKILSTPSSRRKYDRQWNARIGKKKKIAQKKESRNNNNSIISEFKTILFGNQAETNQEEKIYKKIPIKGENVETEINVKLEDAYFGLEKKISLRTVKGKMATFNVKIPSGIRNGEKIRLAGQGKTGINGGKNGDLLIKINILNNKKFKLDGYDLVTDLYITPWEAALGKKIVLNSLEEPVSIYVEPGTQSGEQLRISKKGYKDGQGGRGDLVANIKTMVPKELTQEEKELFTKLKEVSKFNPRK